MKPAQEIAAESRSDRERARDAWDVWAVNKYMHNAPNELVAETITTRVAHAIEAAREDEREECAKLVETECINMTAEMTANRIRARAGVRKP